MDVQLNSSFPLREQLFRAGTEESCVALKIGLSQGPDET